MARRRKKIQTDEAPTQPLRKRTTAPGPADDDNQLPDQKTRATLSQMVGGVSPHSLLAAWSGWAFQLACSPSRQLELLERSQTNAGKLATHTAAHKDEPPFTPKAHDNRFAHPSWQELPFSLWKQGFLAMEDWWDAATETMPGLDEGDAERTRFQVRQALDLMSPSNFPWSNPEIIEETLKTKGQNLIDGAQHLREDLIQALTQSHKPAPQGYRIGEDLACTPGEVVFRNDLFELIQYAPQSEKVRPEPILFIPAWIMKYYVLDLSPGNSMVRYLVRQGFTVFMISWCNPTADQAALSLEDYRKNGLLAALDAINAIVPDARVHANGYCMGGTLLAIAAAAMARDGDNRLASATLMAAQVDFAETGELLLFVGENQVAFAEDLMRIQGYLDRPQMTRTFASIRAGDLIYNRAINRYYLGCEDLPTDIMVWNGDTTRMPARMHSEYLRGLFLENRLSAGRFSVDDRMIALKDISVPMFVVATESDHIAPWRSVYKTQLFTDGEQTFVLTKGGHNSGILSEPGHKDRRYRIGQLKADEDYIEPEAWLLRHECHAGSWWPEMVTWLANRSGELRATPPMGAPDKGLQSLGPAPGDYVHVA
ncbi:MAG: alpha/beta fold hydrolase [Pseudomonadota bacterium]